MGEPVVAKISNAPDGASITISPFPAETLVKPLLEITHPESRLFWGPDGWQDTKHTWPAEAGIGENNAVFSISRKPHETELPVSGEVRLAVPAALIRLNAIWTKEARVLASDGIQDVLTEAEEPTPPTPDKPPNTQPIPTDSSGVASRLRVLPAIAAGIVISLVSAVIGAQFQIRKLASATEDLHRQSEAFRIKDLELQRLSQAVSKQEEAASARDMATRQTMSDLMQREAALRDRLSALATQEATLRQREQDFDRLRQNAGPEIARLQQLQDQLLNDQRGLAELRQSIEKDRRSVSEIQTNIENQQRITTADLKRLSDERAAFQRLKDDVTELQRPYEERIARLESNIQTQKEAIAILETTLRKEQRTAGDFEAKFLEQLRTNDTLEDRIEKYQSRISDYADLQVCNTSRQSATFVFMHKNHIKSENNWIMKGHYNINAGECRTYTFPIGTVYWNAASINASWGGGAGTFCVPPNRFEKVHDSTDCNPSDISRGFSKTELTPSGGYVRIR